LYRLGIDVGGTFTDLSLLNEETGEISVLKVSSTRSDSSKAVIEGIDRLLSFKKVRPEEITYLGHGATVATNAIIEGDDVKVGLITTKGFKDLLEIAKQTRPKLYDFQEDYPKPIVPRNLRQEIPERLYSDGTVREALNKSKLRSVLLKFKNEKIDSLAVCLLYSFLNSKHELKVRQLAQEILPDVYLSISHEIIPEFREYERMSTTTLNAYLMPLLDNYLRNFRYFIKNVGIKVSPYIMQSNGGIMPVETALIHPVNIVLSGPSGGISGAVYLSKLLNKPNMVTLDMGGTSTEVSLIENSLPRITSEREIIGYPIKTPMIDINSIGAGGGSIAWVDKDGLLKVGPKSAGADPGPACYNQGGIEPTVTDANVVLGYLNQEFLLGGKMKINYQAACEAIKNLSEKLNLSLSETAQGIIKIVTSNMVRALKVISVERGYDPKDFCMIAFGGAGPLHASSIADELGIKEIIIPLSPGILCAMGTIQTDLKRDYVRTYIQNEDEIDYILINKIFKDLEEKAISWFKKENVPNKRQLIKKFVDIRYEGQNYELSIEIKDEFSYKSLKDLKDKFHNEHKKNYGHFIEDESIQLVNYRIVAIGEMPEIKIKKGKKGLVAPPQKSIKNYRLVAINTHEEKIKCPIYDRAKLLVNNVIKGPAIIEQMDSTIVLLPRDIAEVDEYKNLIIKKR